MSRKLTAQEVDAKIYAAHGDQVWRLLSEPILIIFGIVIEEVVHIFLRTLTSTRRKCLEFGIAARIN